MTVRVSAYVTPGNTGLVTLTGWYTSVRYHLSGYGDHVLDLFTTPPDDYIIVLGMEVGDGITDLTFRELTFTTLPPVLSPEPPQGRARRASCRASAARRPAPGSPPTHSPVLATISS